MSAGGASAFNFLRGLCTRELEEGGATPDRWVVAQNLRIGAGVAQRRNGYALAAYSTTVHSAVDMNGTDEYFRIPRDPRVHTLPLNFTWRCLVKPDVVNSLQYIFGEAAAAGTPGLKVSISGTGFPVAVFTDSGSTATTLTSSTVAVAGSALGLQVTRAGATLKLWQNGVVVASSTSVSATLGGLPATNTPTIGRHDDNDEFNGSLDYLDLFSVTFANHDDYRLRWFDPRCEYCLYSYTGELDAQVYMRDRGRYEAHAKGVNTPTETTAIAIQDAQVTGIHPRLSRDGKQQVILTAGEMLRIVTP